LVTAAVVFVLLTLVLTVFAFVGYSQGDPNPGPPVHVRQQPGRS
jgi:hypothetical protein